MIGLLNTDAFGGRRAGSAAGAAEDVGSGPTQNAEAIVGRAPAR